MTGQDHRHHGRMWAVVVLALAIVTMAGTAMAARPSVTASLGSDRFPVDRGTMLTVTVTGDTASRPELPRVDGLQFLYQGQSSRMEWVNGRFSSSLSYLYQVRAARPGDYTIGPVRVRVAGQVVKSRPIQCTVLPPASGATGPAAGAGAGGSAAPPAAGTTRLRSGEADRIGFMRIIPKKSASYAGELVPFTIKAYFRQGIRVTVKSQPQVNGDAFVLQLDDQRPQQDEEVVNGIPYTVLTWHGTLSGIKAGTYPLEVDIDTTLLVRRARQHPSSMFGAPFFDDPFFDDFFGTLTRKEIKLVSPRRSLTIRDLPTKGRPRDFRGAIGTFSMAVTASPTRTRVGDPVTLKMRVSGTGNFDLVQAPVFSGGPEWKTYPPSEKFTDKGNGRGTKEFTMAIVPTTAAIKQIPPVTFSYFDPAAGRYTTLRSEAIPLQVTGGTPAAPPPVTTATPAAPAAGRKSAAAGATVSGLAPIHTSLGHLQPAIVPLYRKAWFLALCGLALAMLLAALAMAIRRNHLRKNPHILEERRAREELARHLLAMKDAVERDDGARFLETSRLAIQDRAGQVWHRQPRSITSADLRQHLPADSILVRVVTMAEHAGYSGEVPKGKELRELMEKIRTELEGLS